jgi:hypothetical protein
MLSGAPQREEGCFQPTPDAPKRCASRHLVVRQRDGRSRRGKGHAVLGLFGQMAL